MRNARLLPGAEEAADRRPIGRSAAPISLGWCQRKCSPMADGPRLGAAQCGTFVPARTLRGAEPPATSPPLGGRLAAVAAVEAQQAAQLLPACCPLCGWPGSVLPATEACLGRLSISLDPSSPRTTFSSCNDSGRQVRCNPWSAPSCGDPCHSPLLRSSGLPHSQQPFGPFVTLAEQVPAQGLSGLLIAPKGLSHEIAQEFARDPSSDW